ncbi:MAG: hypothetical protein IPK50_08720 [Fibrobacterota bacterium]|nr:hypothetical protein [Fibrobacterota bacterium]QQS06964.1 MAG: hypothetical protein IPK50_08720 [Fibrobacterota bacterium]
MTWIRTSNLLLVAILLASPFLTSMSMVPARREVQSLTVDDTAQDLYRIVLRDVPNLAVCRDSRVFQHSLEISGERITQTDSCRFVGWGYMDFGERGWHLTRLDDDRLHIVHPATARAETLRKADIEYIEFHPSKRALREMELMVLAPILLTAILVGGVVALTR